MPEKLDNRLRCVDRVLAEVLAPYKGRVYDPCCRSAGMFVQGKEFVQEHGARLGDIAGYGQESNATMRRLAMMNLAIRSIESDLASCVGSDFTRPTRFVRNIGAWQCAAQLA